MGAYLVFTLAAPMASFGAQYDPGERRNSANRPSKSGVLGLIAAALGIERAEEERLKDLADGLGFAVRIEEPGQPAFDFHTAQVPKEASIKKRVKQFGPLRTRADELACDDRKTILSTREYRAGLFASVALWENDASPNSLLEQIRDALQSPHFALYAGRKAHPLMLPCRPVLIAEAASVADAFGRFDEVQPRGLIELKQRFFERNGAQRNASHPVIYSDYAGFGDERVGATERIEQRRDMPESRAKWRFGLRQEAVLLSAKGDAHE